MELARLVLPEGLPRREYRIAAKLLKKTLSTAIVSKIVKMHHGARKLRATFDVYVGSKSVDTMRKFREVNADTTMCMGELYCMLQEHLSTAPFLRVVGSSSLVEHESPTNLLLTAVGGLLEEVYKDVTECTVDLPLRSRAWLILTRHLLSTKQYDKYTYILVDKETTISLLLSDTEEGEVTVSGYPVIKVEDVSPDKDTLSLSFEFEEGLTVQQDGQQYRITTAHFSTFLGPRGVLYVGDLVNCSVQAADEGTEKDTNDVAVHQRSEQKRVLFAFLSNLRSGLGRDPEVLREAQQEAESRNKSLKQEKRDVSEEEGFAYQVHVLPDKAPSIHHLTASGLWGSLSKKRESKGPGTARAPSTPTYRTKKWLRVGYWRVQMTGPGKTVPKRVHIPPKMCERRLQVEVPS